MKRYSLLFLFFLINSAASLLKAQERVELLPYGDMDQWIVREIHESKVIGGKTKYLYEIGPSDTIVGNTAYENMGGSPWANSNVLAKVSGVTKTSMTVSPERRGNGWCVRMETHMESVKAIGVINMEVLAAGSIFLGNVYEPIKSTKNPQANLNTGIPFTKRPKALRFDYKVSAAPEKNRVRSTGFGKKGTVEGQDSLAIVLLLQKRWEDEKGNVYAKRVGTMIQRYTESTADWVNGATYPILYGDISSNPAYQPYMRIQVEERYTQNSKGESVPIQEVLWGEADETPTHIVLQFASSHGGAYIGSPGNTLWIDNVAFVYDE